MDVVDNPAKRVAMVAGSRIQLGSGGNDLVDERSLFQSQYLYSPPRRRRLDAGSVVAIAKTLASIPSNAVANTNFFPGTSLSQATDRSLNRRHDLAKDDLWRGTLLGLRITWEPGQTLALPFSVPGKPSSKCSRQ
jgi:hypothetical protein